MIKEENLEDRFRRLAELTDVALAVSGGPDSMALLHLADRWRCHRIANHRTVPDFTVFTVNHGLRPEAEDECRHVLETASSLGYAAHELRWEGDKPKTRVQEIARNRRYQLLATACHARRIPLLMTAHHLDDQAETMLMRLARGSGLDGLAAMATESRRYGVRLFRPLLDIAKADLVAELGATGWRYIDDPSNDDRRYERARLRNCEQELKRLGLSPQMMGLSAARLGRARRALEETRERFLRESAFFSPYGSARIDQLAFADAAEEVALRALAKTLKICSGNTEPPPLARLERLVEQLREDFSTGHTLGGCRIVAKGDFWLIVREVGRITERAKPLVPGDCLFWDNRYIVCAGLQMSAAVSVGPLGRPDMAKAFVDGDKLKKIPREALSSLLTLRQRDEIIAVPALDHWHDEDLRAGLTVKFVGDGDGLL